MKTTKSGFKFDIKTDSMNDYELLEDLTEIDGGNYNKFPSACAKILGEKQYKALKEHVRNEDGIVPIDALVYEFNEMMALTSAKK